MLMQKIAPRSQNQLDASISLDGIETNKPKDDWAGGIPKQPEYRNPKLLEAVRQLPCVHCGKIGFTQAAHSNEKRHGKGLGRKASDAAIAALCQEEHHEIDNGKMYSRNARKALMALYIITTYKLLDERGFVSGLDFGEYWTDKPDFLVADDFIKQMESGRVKVL